MRRVYDLIVLNPRTHGITGVEILSQIYQQRLQAPVVIIGADGPADSNANERAEPVPGLLYGPVSADEICEAVAGFASMISRKEL